MNFFLNCSMEFFIKLVPFLLVFVGVSTSLTTVSYKVLDKNDSSTEVMVKGSGDKR